jgi:replication fork protection complex subunit Tof1/Swi1
MLRNAKLRLLMTLAGFEWLGIDEGSDTSWIIPSSLSSETLEATRTTVEKYCEHPIAEDDGHDPRDQLRRKRTAESGVGIYHTALDVDFGNDSEGEDDTNFDGVMFPPNIRSRSAILDKLKMTRRKRRKIVDDSEVEVELDEKTLEARRMARQANALARQQKIKSDLFVHASDEESDEEADMEFFAREEERRKEQAARIMEALAAGRLEENHSKKENRGARRKRKGEGSAEDDDDHGERKRQRSDEISTDSDVEGSPLIGDVYLPSQKLSASQLAVNHDTPPTSTEDDFGFNLGRQSPGRAFYWTTTPKTGRIRVTAQTSDEPDGSEAEEDSDNDDDKVPVVRPSRRPRTMAGFLIDSDSE